MRTWCTVALLIALVGVMQLIAPGQGVHAATVTVDTTSDSVDSPGCADDGVTSPCSLRDAVIYANAHTGTVISLPAGTYTLSIGGSDDTAQGGDLDITASVTITGAGAAATIVNAPYDNFEPYAERIFHILAGGSLTMSGVTVSDGQGVTQGGNILNAGTLTVTNVTVTANHPTALFVQINTSQGGGIYNSGTLIVDTGSVISGNSTISSGSGGGIYNANGAVTLKNGASVTTNTAATGGGIYSTGAAATLQVLSGTTVSSNLAGQSGAGIANASGSTATIDASAVGPSNSASAGGGGIANTGATLTVQNTSHIDSNAATNGGGGITNADGAVTIDGSTVNGNTAGTDGAGPVGAGIFSSGATSVLTIRNSSQVSNNTATHGDGGGILNFQGTVALTGSTVSNNHAPDGSSGSGSGAGICNCNSGVAGTVGTLTLTNITLSGNTAAMDGGGIHSDLGGTVTLTGGSVTGNTAGRDGGGIHSDGAIVSLTGTTMTGNSTTAGRGGGIFQNGGSLTVDSSTIGGSGASKNSANGTGSIQGLGGGIFAVSGSNLPRTMAVRSGTTITGNTAANDGGGIYTSGIATTVTNSTVRGNGASRDGGGIYSIVGNNLPVTITASTVSGNTATGNGGGIAHSGASNSLALTNSTIGENTAANGGGLYDAASGVASLTHVTMANNSTGINSAGGVSLANTLLKNTGADCTGTITSGNYNLSGDTSCNAAFTGAHDLKNTAPLLGSLTNNGGTTQTYALLTGSPALDQIPNTGANCIAQDQRGITRPQPVGGLCDIGSFELIITPPTITLSPATLPAGAVTQPYSQLISASGGTGPYSFAVTSGALPGGLNLATDGTLSGTPTTANTFTFTVMATATGGFTGAQSYTVTINPAPTITLAPATLPPGVKSQPYSQTITATGGVGAYTFAVTGGALPSGLTLSTAGLLSGTPTVSGNFSFTITATDTNSATGSQAYTLSVTATPLVSIAVSPASVTVKVGQVQQFAAIGTYADNSTADITTQVAWTSDAPGVASVDAGGRATGFGPGTAHIVATQVSVHGQADVTVTSGTAVGVSPVSAPASRPSGASVPASPAGPAPIPTGR